MEQAHCEWVCRGSWRGYRQARTAANHAVFSSPVVVGLLVSRQPEAALIQRAYPHDN